MTNFNYVGNSTFHVSATTTVEDQESIYLYLKELQSKNYIHGDEVLLLIKIDFAMMTYPEKVAYISNYIKTLLIGQSLEEDLIRNLCDSLTVQSYSTNPVSWDQVISKLKSLGVETSIIEELISQSTKVIPIGASDYVIRDLSSELMQSISATTLSDLKDGAEISIYTTEASKKLMDLVAQLGAGNNWSIDYILYLIYQMAEEALAKLNMASQLSLNSRNSYRYSSMSSELSGSSVFSNLAVINKSTNLLLDEIYSSSDSKVPNRLDLSALLSDLLHSSNSVVFAFNQYKNLDELLNALEHVEGCETIVSRIEYQLDHAQAITEDLLIMIEDTLTKCPTNKIPDQIAKNISGLSKNSNRVPNSEINLGAILASITAAKTLLDNKLTDFMSKFFGEGKDVVNRLDQIIEKLTAKLKTVIGPILSRAVEVIAKITLAVVAVNAILCSFKAAMCAIGSLTNTLSNAMDTAKSYIDKFSSYASNISLNMEAMSDMSKIFSMDTASAVGEAIRDGMISMADEFRTALSSVLSGEMLDKAMEYFSGECSVCSVAGNIFNEVKSHVDELVTSAMDSVTSSVKDGMKCPAMSIPDLSGFQTPSLPDGLDISLPSLNLKLGC